MKRWYKKILGKTKNEKEKQCFGNFVICRESAVEKCSAITAKVRLDLRQDEDERCELSKVMNRDASN